MLTRSPVLCETLRMHLECSLQKLHGGEGREGGWGGRGAEGERGGAGAGMTVYSETCPCAPPLSLYSLQVQPRFASEGQPLRGCVMICLPLTKQILLAGELNRDTRVSSTGV